MKLLPVMLALAASTAQAQIYRCETPEGPVYSDTRCGEHAQLVIIEDESSGISGGPPEEVRAYLAEKRDERAEEREERLRAQAYQPQAPVVVPAQQPAAYPVFWPRRLPPRLRPHRPKPERPAPPPDNSERGDSVLRPPGG